MTSALWPFALVVAVVSSAWVQPTYLTQQDFLNAARLPTTIRRTRALHNDIRFPPKFQREKRGGGVAVLSQNDKWPNGRVPYVISAAYSKSPRVPRE
ncbi:hypothetical protein OESDEN_18627, partial [Oesophagostomum dentatum]